MSEEQIQQSEESFRLLVESVKDYAIFMLNPQGYVTTWNTGAESIKGYQALEIIGKHFSIFYLTEDRESHKPEHILSSALKQGKYEEEARLLPSERNILSCSFYSQNPLKLSR